MSSPLEIKIALHYWTTPGDYDDGRGVHWSSPAVQSIINNFLEAGLLKLKCDDEGQMYARTDALGVWVDAICDVPKPVQKWVIPKREYVAAAQELKKMGEQLYGPSKPAPSPNLEAWKAISGCFETKETV